MFRSWSKGRGSCGRQPLIRAGANESQDTDMDKGSCPCLQSGWHLSSQWFNGGAHTMPAQDRSARELPWGRSFLFSFLITCSHDPNKIGSSCDPNKIDLFSNYGSLCHCRSRGGRDALSNESGVHQEIVSAIHRKVARLWHAEQTPSFPDFLSSLSQHRDFQVICAKQEAWKLIWVIQSNIGAWEIVFKMKGIL